MLVPLLLGGCGLPLGVKIASLFANGVSLLTTEKTLGDHGLSAVAGQDCAVWRGLKGENICHDNDIDAMACAEAGGQTQAPPEGQTDGSANTVEAEDTHGSPGEELAGVEVASGGIEATEETETVPEEVVPRPARASDTDPDGLSEEAVAGVEVAAKGSNAEPDLTEAKEERPPPPPGPAFPMAEGPAPVREKAKARGGTFFVIASYLGISDAERFGRRQTALSTIVLAGTAKGQPVFRVAIGPVVRTHHRDLRADLVHAGFHDVWALKLRKPEVVVELAALD